MQKTFEELKNEFGIESLEGLNDSKVLEQREKYGENALKEKGFIAPLKSYEPIGLSDSRY